MVNKTMQLRLLSGLLLGLVSVIGHADPAPLKASDVLVYRSPTCGCCGRWVAHMRQNGFNVQDVVLDDVNAKKRELGLPEELASCHTAVVDGYVIEGHVPVEDVRKLLKEHPPLRGISAPGMPAGSPGMEMGGEQDAYTVMSFDSAGHIAPYVDHPAQPTP